MTADAVDEKIGWCAAAGAALRRHRDERPGILRRASPTTAKALAARLAGGFGDDTQAALQTPFALIGTVDADRRDLHRAA